MSTKPNDVHWMRQAIKLSKACPVSNSAYSVGAIIIAQGVKVAQGYSRMTGPHDHAEECALVQIESIKSISSQTIQSTLYSTLEPCSRRASKPKGCAQMIIDARIPRVVIAWREPDLFVENCTGVELLRENGVEVLIIDELAEEAREVNKHLFA